MTIGRQAGLNQLLDQFELDALLILSRPNLRYLCHFSGTDGALVLTRNGSTFLTDSRYTSQARSEVVADRITEYSTKVEDLVTAIVNMESYRIGFELEDLTVGQLKRFEKASEGKLEWVGIGDELTRLRILKTPGEIEGLEKVAQLHRKAFAQIEPMLVPGAVEAEIALELELALRNQGAEGKAFDYIVASGPRGAMPHGVASTKALVSGELVTIDFGACLNGYHSDETVTVALGDVSSEMRGVFDIVLEAHDRAMGAVAPGIPLKELDKIARDFISEKGYGDNFGHGLGHGVGLEIHEQPSVSQRSELIAEQNMVFTIEPGIYVEGLGGVRIEDTVVVTESGCRPLTVLPKKFRKIPVV